MVEAGLTCPQCCYDTLTEIGKNKFECRNCGTSFDFDKLRKSLKDLTSCEFTEDFIDELLGDPDLKRYPKLGERGWKWMGRHGVLYTLHTGNSWHLVIRGFLAANLDVVPRSARR